MENYIKKWDDELVQRHIMNEISYIKNYFDTKEIKILNYIDIGANVGKFYDVLKQEYIIQSAVMVEPVPILNIYLKNKFIDTPNCKIYDFAISDEDGEANFSIDCIQQPNPGNINLGLSKITTAVASDNTIVVKMVSGKNFLLNYIKNLEEINLIKIDTENRDYNILHSIQPVIREMKNKPFIVFEHNHRNVLTENEAEQILNNFTHSCGYEEINYSEVNGDWFIKPL